MTEFKLIGLSILCNAAAIVAQASEPTMGGIKDILTTMGPTGILAWYCWYTNTATIPRIVAEFRAEAAAEREFHRQDLASVQGILLPIVTTLQDSVRQLAGHIPKKQTADSEGGSQPSRPS